MRENPVISDWVHVLGGTLKGSSVGGWRGGRRRSENCWRQGHGHQFWAIPYVPKSNRAHAVPWVLDRQSVGSWRIHIERRPKRGKTQSLLTGFISERVDCRVARRAAGAAAGGAQRIGGGGFTVTVSDVPCVPKIDRAHAVPQLVFPETGHYSVSGVEK